MKPIIPTEEQQLPTAFLTDIRSIIDTGRRQAYAAVGQSAIATFWNVGRRIVEEEQNGQGRAAYGTGLIKNLAEQLIPVYGTSYSKRNLDYYRKFYLLFPNEKIVNTRVHNLGWTRTHLVLSVISHDKVFSQIFGSYFYYRSGMALYTLEHTKLKGHQFYRYPYESLAEAPKNNVENRYVV